MSEVAHDNEVVAPALQAAEGELGQTERGDGAGMDPEVSAALDEGNQGTDDEIDAAKDTSEKVRNASAELEDEENASASDMDGIDTELSGSGSGAGAGAPALGSPVGGGMQQPQMPQMQPMSMPQMSPPQPPNLQNMYTMPAQMLKDLAANAKPSREMTKGGGKGGGSDISFGAGAPSKEDKIDPSKVRYDKTGLGPLTDSELNATIEKALDLNGVSDDPKVRGQWHEVLAFMAQHESSRNPDAVNLTDSNAIGAPAADGHPGQSSRGIWQTIPTTFAGNHVAGTSLNIYDPVASGASAVRYIMNRYDVDPDGGSSLQKFYSNRMGGGYTGY